MRKILTTLCLFLAAVAAMPCTNLIVGKKASKDGSVIISYSSDSYGMFSSLYYKPAGKHVKGTMRQLYDYESSNYLGEIPEAEETYRVTGFLNEHQLSIMETTFGGRSELEGGLGIMDYGSLMYVALERCKTAREAILLIDELCQKYGYRSSGESFSIADKNEVWIMELIGKGKEEIGAVWVARRVPDDMISAHANHSRIRQFPLKDKENCLYSKDVIAFARKKGYFNGKDKDFSFSEAYAPTGFGAQRYCEARVWSFFNKWAAEDMKPYLPYAMGEDINPETKQPVDGMPHEMPLWVKPKQLLCVQDVKDMMRDHYEGTPMDISTGLGGLPWNMPYRVTPLSYKVDGKEYFNERPISTVQSSAIYVAQMRDWLPDYIGGLLWFGNDDANMVALTPVYSCLESVPECYSAKLANATTFSFRNAYWMCNWVSNMVYYRYDLLFPELKAVRDKLEKDFNSVQDYMEKKAGEMSEAEGKKFLSDYSLRMAGMMMDEWMQLAQKLIVKYNDMCVKNVDENGDYILTPGGEPVSPLRPGYPEPYARKMVEESGDKYLVK